MKIWHVVTALAILAFLACREMPEFEDKGFAGKRWFKGNTHTHTTMSDGDSPPEVVTKWYKDHGYRFLVLSDHNVFTDPATLHDLVDSTFLLIPGEEVTAKFQQKPVHVNGLNISQPINPIVDTSLVGTIQKNVDAVRTVNGVPHINHPNFGWALSHRELLQINNDKLLEIFNGHPHVNNFGGGGWPSMEQVWDHLLTAGKEIYGIAVDDAHHFQGEFAPGRSNPGRGWVAVRAKNLDVREIVESLEKGLFYATTGVELDDIKITSTQIEIYIAKQGDFKFRTEFIGAGGKILLNSEINPAIYQLSGDMQYVRAKVYNSGGYVAWVQPVFARKP
ncbi:CehA/McbA family metallohydrolase [candidate division KSB1 bacterium]|nr:CehA/McbA family metallohydrolase [candidate division KSB1 bacterium]